MTHQYDSSRHGIEYVHGGSIPFHYSHRHLANTRKIPLMGVPRAPSSFPVQVSSRESASRHCSTLPLPLMLTRMHSMHALYFHARRDVIRYTAPRTQRFIKHFLPVVFITLINMVTYLLNYDEYMARITICIGTLTALVSALQNIYIYLNKYLCYT